MKTTVKIQFLSSEDKEQIFETALHVLKEIGVRVDDEVIFEKLLLRGCKSDGKRIRIEPQIVKECLEEMNKKPIVKCANGKELKLYNNHRYYGSLIIDPFVLDYKEGLRKPVLNDIVRHAKLGDALPRIDCIYKMDIDCTDVDKRIADLKTIEAFVSNTTTAYFCAPDSMESLKTWVDISEIMAGGSLLENPILVGYVPMISPLFFSKENGEQFRYCIERNVVLRCGPCPMAGATAPFTIAGTLVQGLAELIFQIVAAQSIKSGTAVIAAIGGHNIDMKTGRALYGGPIKDILHAASLEMLEYLDLPVIAGVFSTLCPSYGIQNGIESALSIFFTYFCRNHIMMGMGSLGNACGVSAEQILIHHDMIDTIERYNRGIEVNKETLGFDSIKTNILGNFLTDDLTLKYLKTGEHYISDLVEIYAPGWDKKTMIDKVHEQVEEIIATHKPKVNEARLEKVREYIQKRSK